MNEFSFDNALVHGMIKMGTNTLLSLTGGRAGKFEEKMINDAMKRVVHDFNNVHYDTFFQNVRPLLIENGAMVAATLVLAARVDELIEHFDSAFPPGGENEHTG